MHEGREDDSGTHAGSDLDLDIDGDVNVAPEPQSSDDFVVDTIGSGKVLSPIARQGRARRRVPPMVVSESDDDDGGGKLLVDNASDDDDFVANRRSFQQLRRTRLHSVNVVNCQWAVFIANFMHMRDKTVCGF